MGTIEAREDVLHRAAVAELIAGETGLHDGLIAGSGKFIEDAEADYVVLRAACGMRDAVADETVQYFAGARGGKVRRGSVRGLGCGRLQAFERKKKYGGENE